MALKILKCPKCDTYLLHETCPKCDVQSLEVKPPKYSPEDKYGKYRRQAKRKGLEEKGLA